MWLRDGNARTRGAGAALLGAGIAFALGFAVGARTVARGMQAANDLGTTILWAYAADAATGRYLEGTSEEAVRALTEYLELLADLEAGPGAFFMGPSGIASERALTHARIAAVRREAGDDAGAERSFEAARAACALAGWKDCSATRIDSARARRDAVATGGG